MTDRQTGSSFITRGVMDYFSHVFVAKCPEDPIFLFYFISCILLLFILFVAFFSGSINNTLKKLGRYNRTCIKKKKKL